MAEEVLLEVVDEVNSLVEEFLVFTTVHQDGLCTKHLRHLGEDRCSALSNQPVREFTYQWIGCDSAEAVRTATLQTYAELAYRHVLALVFLSLLIEVTEQLHAFLQLIAFNLLCYKKFDAVLIVVAKHLHESVSLIVLTAEREYEHSASIWMKADVSQHLTGVLMVA